MVATGVPGATPFGGHAGPVNCVAFSPDGATFVTGGDDGVLRLWDLAEREQLARFAAPRGHARWHKRAWAVAFSPQGTSVAAGYDDGLQLWDIAAGEAQRPMIVAHGQRIWSVAFSPDGGSIATASDDATARVWDAETGHQRVSLAGHEGTVFDAVYSPDGARLASAGEDGTIRVWEAGTGQEIARLTAPGRPAGASPGSVRSVGYSPDGTGLVSGGGDGIVRIWDAAAGTLRAERSAQRAAGDEHRVWCVAYSPDGTGIASGGDDGAVRRWDAAGRELPRLTGHTGTVSSVAYSPDGSAMITVSGGDRTIRIWDAASGTQLDRLTGHTGTVHLLAYSPDGTAIATGGEDHTVRVWDAATGAQTAQVSGHKGEIARIAYNADGSRLAIMDEGRAVHVWDTESWQERVLQTWRAPGAGALAYSPDGATIVTAGRGRGTRRLDGIIQFWAAATGQLSGGLTVPDTAHVDAVAYSRDGALIAVSSTRLAHPATADEAGEAGEAGEQGSEKAGEHSIQLYDVGSRRPAGPPLTSARQVDCLAFSPDRASIAFDGGNVARIWRIGSEEPAAELAGHDDDVRSIAYSSDGTTLVTAGGDGTVRLWEARTRQQRGTLTGHTEEASAVAYSPDGGTLASAGLDGTIRIWNPRTGEQVYGTGFRPARVPSRQLAGVRSDSPSTADMLGIDDDVQTLAELIAATETRPPLAIALIGGWGTGKSSLMLQVEREVAALAGRARKNPGRSPFAESIRQVRFNAWHYSDDRLWAGLVSRLFEALKAPEDPGTVDATELAGLADAGAAETESESAIGEIRRLKDRRASLQHDLETWRTDKQEVEADLRQAEDTWNLLRASARRAMRRFRGTVLPLLGWLAVIAGAWVVWHFLGARVGSICAAFAVAGGPVAFVSKVQSAHQETRGFANKLRAELEDDQREDARRIEAMQREIQETENQIYLIDAATWLRQFLDDRGSTSEHLRYQGLLGLVRADFEQLSEKLAQARAQWARGGYIGAAPLERIVLYIDDLDRCPPQGVVEVLQAIHLMLALDLFVVVVAVDPRWLIQSLEYHHRELFGAGVRRADGAGGRHADGVGTDGTNGGGTHGGSPHASGPQAGGGRPGNGDDEDDWTRADGGTDPADAPGGPDQRLATPIDYLDKIFQIPFALLPPTTDAAASYLRHLLPRPARGAEPLAGAAGFATVNGSGPANSHAPGSPEASRNGSGAGRAGATASQAGATASRTDAGVDWVGAEADRAGSGAREGVGEESGELDERELDPRGRPVEAAERGGVEAVELPPQQLQVSAAEVDFMARLGRLLPTPRAAKRLVNVYRLVRIGVRSADLAAFVGDELGGPYQAVQVLLAILVGHPEFARRVFLLVLETTSGELPDAAFADLVAVVELAGRSGGKPGGNTQSSGLIHSLLAEVREDSPLSVSIDECRRWCPRLARFSFYTRDLAGRHLDMAAGA